jgi:cell wall-associated NlpC family hydrolase
MNLRTNRAWILVLGQAATLPALQGCGTAPTASAVRAAPAAAYAGAEREALLDVVRAQIGAPYRYGGSSPATGFDCSGLVHYAHRHLGLDVPRTTAAQWRAAAAPQRPHLVPGDLLFFEIGRDKSRHVAIYEGGGRFIHAPSPGKRVGRASLDNPYWRERLLGARSFL